MNEHRCVLCGEKYLDDGSGPAVVGLLDAEPGFVTRGEIRFATQWKDGPWVGTCDPCWHAQEDPVSLSTTAFRLLDATGAFNPEDQPYPGAMEPSS